MGRTRSENPSPNAIAQRLSRQRKKQRQREVYGQDFTGIDADERTDYATSSDIVPPGLIPIAPSPRRREAYSPDEVETLNRVYREIDEHVAAQGASTLEEEQALWVKRRRELTELALARQRGDLVSATEAKQQSANRGRRFRAVLDRIPANLPSHLSPDHRSICEAAIKQAVALALVEL